MAADFKALWNKAEKRCCSQLEFSAVIADIRCIFRSPCEWTTDILKQILCRHLVFNNLCYTHEHEIVIVPVEQTGRSSKERTDVFWNGKMFDGTSIKLRIEENIILHLQVGCEVSIWINSSEGRTLCMFEEIPDSNGLRRRPQPGGYFFPLLQMLLAAYKLYVIHAAAVVFRGRCLLLLGPSGSGKTTMSVALARAGMEFMGDDLIIVGQRDKELLTHALLFTPKVKTISRDDEQKADCIVADKLGLCYIAPIAGVAFLQRNSNISHRFLSVPHAQVLTWLLQQGNDMRLMCNPQNWFDTASAIADNVPGWLWKTGRPAGLKIEDVREIFDRW